MSGVFSRLVDRALDRAPRARPQLAPRFGRRAGVLPLEEPDLEVESPSPSPHPAALPLQAPVRERPAVSARREGPTDAAPRAEPRANVPAAPGERASSVEEHVRGPGQQVVSTVERSFEHVVQSVVDHTHLVETRPLATPPVALRSTDVAALRPAEPRATSRGPAEPPSAASIDPARSRTPEAVEPEAIHVTIGRIDVRATPAVAPVSVPSRARPAPMGLDEYLRRRNEGR